MANDKKNKKENLFSEIFFKIVNYFKNDIWRIDERKILNRIMLIILYVVSYFIRKKQVVRAASLTYYTTFALIPTLAFIFGIARGFGYDTHIKRMVIERFGSQTDFISTIFSFIENYLIHTKGGVFVGIGIFFLIYSVMRVFIQIENSFNDIWNIKEHRKLIRRFTDYMTLLLLIPFLAAITSGISFYFKYVITTYNDSYIISPTLKFFLLILPYFITWLAFTLIYMVMPNIKVKFVNAAVAAFFAGLGFQLFRLMYIHFQTWATGYNAIYGSLAAIPLLMLFVQISWCIVLFGAQISYALQIGVKNSFYGRDVKHISYRYSHFVMLCLANIIFTRYESNDKPLSVIEISNKYNIPHRLVKEMLLKLLDAGVLYKADVETKDDSEIYLPALDIHSLSVANFFEMIDNNCFGLKSNKKCFLYEKFYNKKINDKIFGLETREEFSEIWKFTDTMKKAFYEMCSTKLVKDLNLKYEKN